MDPDRPDPPAESESYLNKELEEFPPLNAGEPTYQTNLEGEKDEVASPSGFGDMNVEKASEVPPNCANADTNNLINEKINRSGTQATNHEDGGPGFNMSNQPTSSDSVHSLGGYSEPPPIYAHPGRFGLPIPFLGPHITQTGSNQPLYQGHPLTRVVEFRTDIALGTIFKPTYPLNCPPPFDQDVFQPMDKVVITTAESVIHYINHPYTVCLNGNWITGIGHFPLAQHLCICMDDGIRRYESVIRVDLPCPETERKREVTGVPIPNPNFQQVHNEIRPSRVSHKPTFKRAINKSLMSIIAPFASEQPYEIVIARPNGKYVQMDRLIDNFVTQEEPYQTFFYPIIHYALENIDLKLQGAQYGFNGNFYRPVLSAATLIISGGEYQLLDTVELKMCVPERRIYCMSYDSTMARRDNIKDVERVSLVIMDSVSYVDAGPYTPKPNKEQYWGPDMPIYNPRIPLCFHPMKNLIHNPVLNEQFNPYATYAFQIPPIPTHPTVPSAIPCNHFLGTHGTPAYPEMSVVPCIVPAREFYPGPSASPANFNEISALLGHPSEHDEENQVPMSSSSRLNPDAKDFYPRNSAPPASNNYGPVSMSSQTPDPGFFRQPFPPENYPVPMAPSCTPLKGPIYLNPYEDTSEDEQEHLAQFDGMGSSRTSPRNNDSSTTLVACSSTSTETGQNKDNAHGFSPPGKAIEIVQSTRVPTPQKVTPTIVFPTLEISMCKSWSEEMEAHHSFHEAETYAHAPSPAVVAQAYDYNQLDDTGRPLRRAPSRDWNPNERAHREWNTEGHRPREWSSGTNGPAPPSREWNSNGSQREWTSTGPPAREWTSNGPSGLPRDWDTNRPPAREWNSNGPPPREWPTKGPPSREWDTNAPPAREWRGRGRYPRGGGGYRHRYDSGGSENAGNFNAGESGGNRENTESYAYSGESGHDRERQADSSGYYGSSGFSDGPRGRAGYYGGRGRGSRGGRGRFYNPEYRNREEPRPRQLILCSPRSSDIDLNINRNQTSAPSSSRKDKGEAGPAPRKTPRKKYKTPRKDDGENPNQRQNQNQRQNPAPTPRHKNLPSSSTTYRDASA